MAALAQHQALVGHQLPTQAAAVALAGLHAVWAGQAAAETANKAKARQFPQRLAAQTLAAAVVVRIVVPAQQAAPAS